jgi:protein-S-isoprenylcysteine O-methyltransferase Ste14
MMMNKKPSAMVHFCMAVFLMFMLHKYLPGFTVFTNGISHIIGFIFCGFGLAMMLKSMMMMKKEGNTVNTMDAPTKLITEGMFGYCRNPMYLGMVIALFGIFFFMGSSTPLIMVLIFGGVMEDKFIRPEEKMLEEKFGKDFIDYKFKVSKWFPLLTTFAYEKTKK